MSFDGQTLELEDVQSSEAIAPGLAPSPLNLGFAGVAPGTLSVPAESSPIPSVMLAQILRQLGYRESEFGELAKRRTPRDLCEAITPLVKLVRRGAEFQLSQTHRTGAADILLAAAAREPDAIFCKRIAAQIVRMIGSTATRIELGTVRSTVIGTEWQFIESFPTEIYRRFPVHMDEMSTFSRELYRILYRFLEAGGDLSGSWGKVEIDRSAVGSMRLSVTRSSK